MQLLKLMTTVFLAGAAAQASAGSNPDNTAPVAPQVKIDAGSLTGTTLGAAADVYAYQGIPYAQPPTGANRWQEPKAVTPWTNVLAATTVSKACPQPAADLPILNVGDQDEDCLYLNVYRPVTPASGPRPVLFWIHGGSDDSGATSIYSGEYLARAGAVVVTMNYRLGALGFMVRQDLVHTGGDSAVGNYGLLDQLAALRWVHRNIAVFGGDPANVTIFGQSAGGDAVARHMVAPAERGLFQRAIMQSGFPEDDQGKIAAAQKDADTLADRLGCSSDADVVGCMRQADAQDIISASAGGLFQAGLDFEPFVDGTFTPSSPLGIFQKGGQAQVPVMVGSTQDEAELFTTPLMINSVAKYKKALKSWFGADGANQVFQTFPAATDKDAATAAARVATAADFTTPAVQTLHLVADQGLPAFEYHFERLAPYPASYHMGIFHGIDIFYLFGWIGQHADGFTADDTTLSNDMLTYWVNFAATGNPNHAAAGLVDTAAAAVAWPPFDSSNEGYLRLNTPSVAATHLCTSAQAHCDLFTKLSQSGH